MSKKKIKQGKCYNLFENDGVKELRIIGDIEYEWMVSEILWELSYYDSEKEIRIVIDSDGGDAEIGFAIYSMLKVHPARIIVQIISKAHSVASVITQAADHRQMFSTAVMHVHEAWAVSAGTAADMRHTADFVEKRTQQVIDVYVESTGHSEEVIREMLESGTTMTAEEALDLGFIDEIIEETPATEPTSVQNKKVFNTKNNLRKKASGLGEPKKNKGKNEMSKGKKTPAKNSVKGGPGEEKKPSLLDRIFNSKKLEDQNEQSRLDAAREAAEQAATSILENNRAIFNHCKTLGREDLAGSYMSQGLTLNEVKNKLQEDLAVNDDETVISSRVDNKDVPRSSVQDDIADRREKTFNRHQKNRERIRSRNSRRR